MSIENMTAKVDGKEVDASKLGISWTIEGQLFTIEFDSDGFVVDKIGEDGEIVSSPIMCDLSDLC